MHYRSCVRACSMLLLSAVLLAPPVFADDPGDSYKHNPDRKKTWTDVRVDTGPSGVTIRISAGTSKPGESRGPTSPSASGAPSGVSCSAYSMPIGHGTRSWFEQEAPKHPNESPWMVSCDNGYNSPVWLPLSNGAPQVSVVNDPGSIAPIDLNAEVERFLPIPDITIQANPDRGLVAVPSWFWIEGYDGEVLYAAVALGEFTVVEVELWATSYDWEFGNGATLRTTSRGRRYPQPSDIVHTYQQSSFSAGGQYRVTVEVTFTGRMRVNNGDWNDIGPIRRSFAAGYPIQQLQSVLVPR